MWRVVFSIWGLVHVLYSFFEMRFTSESISVLLASAVSANVIRPEEPATSTVPDYFQTSYGPYAGPTAAGELPFLAQTNPVLLGNPTYVPNTPVVTDVPVAGCRDGGEIFKHMGNLSPYMPNPVGFGVKEYPLPPGANITQMHMIHRHGSRYPTIGAGVADLPDRIAELLKNGTRFLGNISFLNSWEYQLGKEELTALGRQQLFNSGVLNYFNYGRLYDASKSLIARTTTQVRMLQSAENFLNGFFGPNWTKNVTLEVIIEHPGFNNSLSGDNLCTNSKNGKSSSGDEASTQWQQIYLKDATERFRRSMHGSPNWTVTDTYNAQTMCPYETIALGYSPFCSLFTWDEWLGFEYSIDLSYHGNNAFGSPTGRAVGLGYVEELIARLQQHFPQPDDASIAINETLDTSATTFPLDQNLYLDFSHDTDIMSILTALGLRQFNQSLPATGPPDDQQLIVSHIVPFAGRFNIEVIKAPRPVRVARSPNSSDSPYESAGSETVYVHMLMNQRTIPLGRSIPECGKRDDGWCELQTFIKAQQDNIAKANFHESCFGDYPAPAQIQEFKRKLDAYEELLQYLMPKVKRHDRELISNTLERYSAVRTNPPVDNVPSSSPELSSVGADYVEEDYNRTKRLQAFGFVGGHSELSWMKDLRRDIDKSTSRAQSESSESKAALEYKTSGLLTSVSYFLDDNELFLDEEVVLYHRPPRHVADKLVNLYFHTVHPSFPIIGKLPFMQQYVLYYSTPNLHPPDKWLAILNLVFALGAKYAKLTTEPWVDALNTPLEYFTRSHRFGFAHDGPFDHPSLQQVQVEGLATFFLMTIGHINRAWRTCGLAVRSALAMGINYRNESQNTPKSSKELRYRVWWAVYTVENTLSIMTGRPISATDRFCTTPLPIPYEEDQFQGTIPSHLLSSTSIRLNYMHDFLSRRSSASSSSSSSSSCSSTQTILPSDATPPLEFSILDAPPSNSLYFLFFVDITRAMRRATDTLYAPGFSRQPWFRINEVITDSVNETDAWLRCLPDVFQFKPMHDSQIFERQRWSLAFQFYSLKITVSRLSLCRSGRQRLGPPLRDFTIVTSQRNAAKICVNSACDILALLPDSPDMLWLTRVSPWWCVLHYIMQSVTVLLIELDFCVKFSTDEVGEITPPLEKGMEWILEMAAENAAAQRAWDVCNGLYCSISRSSAAAATPVAFHGLSDVLHGESPGSLAASEDMFAREEPYIPLPENMIEHPTLQTMYDQFTPCDFDFTTSEA
ncbi:hypothetical protein FE257_006656 [Aspergillus nanangensis]|uniref:3-phytase n=1 Tax=Aspergillus nanangensis TaxID=2582783 RepID=A0AAD4CXX8_ASPNN|nr:hypothetical protein FE257_006656 [Aspergillus nanangensis]